MAVVLSHECALKVLLNNRHLARTIRCPLPETNGFSKTDLREIQTQLGLKDPQTDLLASKRNQAHHFPTECVAHYCGKLKGIPAFIRIENAYISCPELAFVQAAGSLTLVQAILLGYSLCGDYRPSKERFRTGEQPLTAVKKLESFIDALPPIKGLGTARKAVRFIIDGSNSAQESRLAIALSLPLRHGGFGLEKPHLNAIIPGTKRKADLLWEKQHLVVEYDSALHHNNEKQRDCDALRSTQIELKDFYVISVRPAQVQYFASYVQLGTLIGKQLGVNSRAKSRSYAKKQYELWTELYRQEAA